MDASKQTQKRLVLKGGALLKRSGLSNVHQVSLQSQISAQTAYKYLETPEKVKAVDLDVLTALLTKGLGMTKTQILDLKLGDLFDLTEPQE